MFLKKIIVGLLTFFISVLGYSQQLSVPKFTTDTYGSGASITVPVNISGCFGLTNRFNMYLSNETGSFGAPVLIGSYDGFFTPFVNGVIPASAVPGTKYRIRITSTAPVTTVETVDFEVASAAVSQVPKPVTSASNTFNDSTFGRCQIFGNTNIVFQESIPAGHTLAAFVTDSLGNPVASTVSGTQIQFTMVPYNYYTLKIQLKNNIDNSISTRSFLVLVSANNVSLQTSGASDACLPDRKVYTVNITGNGGIRYNYPGTKYTIEWGDGGVDTYTHCALLTGQGEMAHDYTNTSCGQPPITDLSPTQYNAFRVNVKASNAYCPNSFTSITTYCKVWQKPYAEFTNPMFGCINTPITFANNSQNGLSGYNNVVNCIDVAVYEWYVDGNLIFNAPRDLTYTFTTPGYHTIRLVAVNDPCSDDIQKVICIEEPVVPDFIVNGKDSISGCAPLVLTIQNNTTIGPNPCRPLHWKWEVLKRASMTVATEGIDYTISPNDSVASPTVTFLLPGEYYLRLSIGNSCGIYYKDVPVTIIGTADVKFSTNYTRYCGLKTIDFGTAPHRPTYNSNSGTETFLWTITGGSYSFTSGTTATSAFPVIKFNDYTPYTVRVEFFNDCGMQNATQVIVFDSAVTASAINDTTVCFATNSIQLNGTYTGIPAGRGWSIISGSGTLSSTSVANPVYTFSAADRAAGSVQLRYTVSPVSGSACSPAWDDVIITILPEIVITSAKDTTICSGGTVSYSPVSNTSGTTYTWTSSVVSGTISGNTASGTGNISDVLINASASANGVVKYVITPSSNGCTSSAFELTVTVIGKPDLTVNVGKDTLCTGETTQVNLSSSFAGALYTWTANVVSGAVTGVSSQLTPSANNQVYQTLTNTGTTRAIVTYTIQVHSTGAPCPGETKTVTIVVEPGATIANAGADRLLCNQPSVTLSGNQPTMGTGTWTQISGPSSSIVNANLYNTTVNGLQPNSTYTFVWKITGAAACPTSSDTLVIVNRPANTTANAGTDKVYCDFDGNTASVILSASSVAHPFETGTWTLLQPTPAGSNASISNVNDPTSKFSFDKKGTYTLVWSISNDAGCAPTLDTVVVRVFEVPSVGAITPAISNICIGENVTLAVAPIVGNIVKWQYNTAPFADNIWKDTLVTAAYLNLNNIQDSMLVRVIVQSEGAAFGCTATDTSELALIEVSPKSVGGNTNADATVCSGNNSGTIKLTNYKGAIVRWETSTNNGITWMTVSNLSDSILYNNLTATTWYRAVVQSGTCTAAYSSATIITVIPVVSQAQAGNDQTICGTTVSLQSNAPLTGETGLWSQVSGPGAAVLSSTSATNITASNLIAGSYQFVWTLANSTCPSTADTVTINVRPAVTPANAGNDVVVCDFVGTASTTLSGNSNLSRAFETGAWTIINQPSTGNGSFSNTGDPNAVFTFNASGTYQLVWTLSNDAGCTPTKDTVVIYAFDKPAIGTISGITDLCAGGDVAVSLSSYTGLIKKWQYNPAPVSDNIWIDTAVTNTSINFLSVTDTFAVRVIVQSDGAIYGCTSADTSNVLVVNVVPATTGGTTATPDTVCSGTNNGIITLSGHVGTIIRWEASTDNGNNWTAITNTTATNTYNNLTATTWYRAVVESGNCGSKFSTVTIITVLPALTPANAGNDQLVCGSSASLQSNAPATGETGAWSQISGPNNATLSSTLSTNITATGLVAGTYKFVWALSNNTCPPSIDTVFITVRPAVTTANAGNDMLVCDFVSTASVTLAANSNPARSFEMGAWTIISQPANSNASFSNAADPASTFTFNIAGVYKLQWMISNDANCTPTKDTITINAFDKPIAGPISGITNLCAGGDVPVTLSSFTGLIKKWQYNPAPISDNIWIDTLVTNASINFLSVSDTFAVRVIVQSAGFAFGCNATDTSNVLVVNVTPNTMPGTTGPATTVCSGSNSGVITLTGNVGSVVRWEYSTNSGSTWTPVNNTTSSYNFSNLTTSTLFRAVVLSGSCGNIGSSSTLITVVPEVTPANAGPDQTGCSNNVVLNANTVAANESGTWSQVSGPSNATFSSTTSSSVSVTNLVAGNYQFIWTISNGACAPTSDTVVVVIRPSITPANAGQDTVICDFYGNVNITLHGSNNYSRTYETKRWTILSQPLNGNAVFSDSSDANTNFNFNASGVYVLQYSISNDGGCSPSKDTVVINVFDKPVAGPITGNTNICAGNDVVVTLNSYTGIIQKWQYNPAPVNDNIWKDTAVTNSTITFTAVRDTMAVRVIVQSAGSAMGCNAADTSNVLVIKVTPTAVAGTTAASDTVCSGSNGGVITLSGNVGAVVRWESSVDNGNNWTPINNITNANQYNNLSATTWFRAVIQSGSCGTVPSSITVITVLDSITIPNAGNDQVLCNASQAVLSANSVSFGETGTWTQVSGPATTFSANNIPTITVSNLQPGTYTFVYTIANATCPSVRDSVVIINYAPIVNLIDTTSKTICYGSVLSVAGQLPTGGNGAYTYQWQQSTNGTNWINISGQVAQSLNIIPGGTIYVRRLVNSLPCTSISETALITVQPPVANNTIAANQNICTNTTPALISGSLPTGATGSYNYQWQESTDSGRTWINIPGASGQHYQPGVLTLNTWYRRNVSSGLCTASQSNYSDSVVVTVNADAKAFFTYAKDTSCPVFVLDTNIISNQHFAAGNGGYLWYANNNLIGTTQDFPGYSISNSGDSVVIKLVAISAFGCKNDSIQHTFYAKMKPSPTFTVSDSVGCGPLTVLFTNTTPNASVFQYKWNFGNGQQSNAFNPGSVAFMPNASSADTIYKVSLTVYSECDSVTIYQNIRVKAKPRALFSPDKTFGCSPLQVTFRNVSRGSNDFTWDFGDGSPLLNTPSTNSVQHTFVTNVRDTFVVKLIARNSCGSDTQRYSIIVSPNDINLFITVNGTETSGCSPHAVTFYNNSVGASSFIWNFGDSNTQTTYRSIDTIVHVFNQPGVYTVQIRASNGCADTVTYKTITVHGTPKVDFTATPATVCVGENVRFNNLSDTITNSAWSFGDGSVSSLNNPNHAYSAAGTYTIRLIGSRQYATGAICLDSAKATVTVFASRPGSFTVSDSVSRCVPFTVTFTNQSLPSSLTTWDFGNGKKDTGNVVTHTFTSTGTFNVVMNAQSPGGCKYQAAKNIIVNGPQGTMNYDKGVICGTVPVRFETNTNAVDSVKWNFGDGTSLVTTASIIFHTYTQAGQFVPSVHLIAGANGSCKALLQGVDTIKVERIKAGFTTAMLKECGQTKVMFYDTTRSFFGVQKWSWNFGDGGTANVQNPQHAYTTANNWPITLISQSKVGCTDTSIVTLEVSVNDIPKAFISSDTVACAGTGINFQSSVISADNISLYLWKFTNGATATTASTSTSFATAGNHMATLVVSTGNGCLDTVTRNIVIKPSPYVLASNNVGICKGQVAQLTVSGASSYTWTPATTLSCATCTSPIASPTSTTVYEVTGTNLNGCSAKDTVRVTIAQPFKISATPNDTICIGQSIQLFAQGAEVYKWSPGTSLNKTDVANPVATPTLTTKYRVVGSDSASCFTDTAYVNIAVGKIPTVDLGPDKVVAAGTFYPLVSTTTNGPIVKWEWRSGNDITCNNCPLPTAYIKRDINYSVTVTNLWGCEATDAIKFTVFCENSAVFIPNVFTPDHDGINDVLMVRGKGIKTVKMFRIFNRWGELVFEKANFSPNEKAHGWDGTIRGVKAPPDVYVYTCEVTCENDTPFIYKGNVAIIK